MDAVQLWKDAVNDPVANRVVMIFLLVCLILVAIYIVSWFRNLAIGKFEESINPLEQIERLKAEGKIDFAEYHRLKKSAAQSLSSGFLLTTKKKLTREDWERLKKVRSSDPGSALDSNQNAKSIPPEHLAGPIDFAEAELDESE